MEVAPPHEGEGRHVNRGVVGERVQRDRRLPAQELHPALTHNEPLGVQELEAHETRAQCGQLAQHAARLLAPVHHLSHRVL